MRGAQWIALSLLAFAARSPAGEKVAPGGSAARTFFYLPPGIEDRVVFYHSFELGAARPELDLLGAQVSAPQDATPADGLAARGLRVRSGHGSLKLASGSLTLARPLTVMMWWRFDEPMRDETGYHLITLGGKGIVSAFARGKGEWCALKEPTFVFQVYYFEGITNMNHIWSGSARVEPGTWHHIAVTVAGAAEVRAYWDGLLRVQHTIKGRQFRTGDVNSIEFGHPMTIDELVVLDRALSEDEIAAYVEASRALAAVRFPCMAPESRTGRGTQP